jgi:hypothetical protein
MIKIKHLLAAALLLVVISCKKDGDGPLTIKLKSISSTTIPVNGGMQLVFDFTESNSIIDSFGFIKIRTNQNQTETVRDTLYYSAPDYPKSLKGQLQIDITYEDLYSANKPPTSGNPPVNDSDSLIFKFFAKDQAKHTSDTVTTGQIIVFR